MRAPFTSCRLGSRLRRRGLPPLRHGPRASQAGEPRSVGITKETAGELQLPSCVEGALSSLRA
eukprot:2598131-Pyramimonas_sp.AAC.1